MYLNYIWLSETINVKLIQDVLYIFIVSWRGVLYVAVDVGVVHTGGPNSSSGLMCPLPALHAVGGGPAGEQLQVLDENSPSVRVARRTLCLCVTDRHLKHRVGSMTHEPTR